MPLSTQITTLATRVATEFKALRTLVNGNAADLAGLSTTAKNNLVAAINEVNAKPSSTPAAATDTAQGIVELATSAEALTGTDTVRAVTPAGVQAVRAAIEAKLTGPSVPAALDTLVELANAIGDDANFAATITASLGNRVRVDAAQTLTTGQQSQGRSNIGAVAATDVGNTEADFVATFNAGLV